MHYVGLSVHIHNIHDDGVLNVTHACMRNNKVCGELIDTSLRITRRILPARHGLRVPTMVGIGIVSALAGSSIIGGRCTA